MVLFMNYGNALGIEFRGVSEVTHNGKAARSVSGNRYYDTDTGDLWDALTNPERIPRWFLPISGDLHPGGHYQLEGHAGGKITRCNRPNSLRVTWEYGENVSWVLVKLAAEKGGTRLTLEHIMLKDPESEAHWKIYGPGATGVGWDLSFLALNYHLVNGNAAIDAKENEAWTASEAGKYFIRDSARQWGDVHIQSGEDKQIALDMAEMTAKFYTGE